MTTAGKKAPDSSDGHAQYHGGAHHIGHLPEGHFYGQTVGPDAKKTTDNSTIDGQSSLSWIKVNPGMLKEVFRIGGHHKMEEPGTGNSGHNADKIDDRHFIRVQTDFLGSDMPHQGCGQHGQGHH